MRAVSKSSSEMGRGIFRREVGRSIEEGFFFPRISVHLIPFVQNTRMSLAPELKAYGGDCELIKGHHSVCAVAKAKHNAATLIAHRENSFGM